MSVNTGEEMDFSGSKRSLSELKGEAEAQVKQAKEESKGAPPATLTPRKRNLRINYMDPQGEWYGATVVIRAPDGEDRDKIAVLRAKLTGGVGFGAFAPEDQDRFIALANVAILIEPMPPWLDKAFTENNELLFKVGTEVALHGARYFRGDLGEGQEGPIQSRVRVELEPIG